MWWRQDLLHVLSKTCAATKALPNKVSKITPVHEGAFGNLLFEQRAICQPSGAQKQPEEAVLAGSADSGLVLLLCLPKDAGVRA